MKLNGSKFETKLSLNSIEQSIKRLEVKKQNYPKIAMNIVNRLTEEILEIVYPDSERIPAVIEGNTVVGSVVNKEKKWLFHEYGTGVIGSQFPHVAEALAEIGWKYDVNQHGETGWWYPTTESDPNPYKWTDPEGTLRAWTKGLPAERAFYEALQRAEEMYPVIAYEELMKSVRS